MNEGIQLPSWLVLYVQQHLATISHPDLQLSACHQFVYIICIKLLDVTAYSFLQAVIAMCSL